MDIHAAQEILQLPPNFTPVDAKKQYHRLCLRFHPDKNRAEDASARFREVNRAYRFLQDSGATDGASRAAAVPRSYDDMLLDFITAMYADTGFSDVLFRFVKDVMSGDLVLSLELLREKSAKVLVDCCRFLSSNRAALGIPIEVMGAINEVIKTRSGAESVYVASPSLQDMFDSNVLRLNYRGAFYLIPLWHSSLSFDIDDTGELDVSCIPDLPGHMSLDNDNNLHVYVRTKAERLLDKHSFDIDLEVTKLSVLTQRLRLTRHQTVTYEGQGIPRIDERDIYNNEVRGNIVVHLELA